MDSKHWFASCPRGLESLLLAELQGLGAQSVRETVAGCAFDGTLAAAYRVALWSRLANRILLSLDHFRAADPPSLHRALLDFGWENVLPPRCSFVVSFSGRSQTIRNTQYGARVVKDAVVDRFHRLNLPRPAVDRQHPDIRFQCRLDRDVLTLSLDLVGASLHQRGYRSETGAAPLKENLAAAMLLRADWPGIAARGGALIDPLCGSGTLLIEGALMAADIAPGLQRQHWAFEKLPFHNARQWQALCGDAAARAERGKAASLPEIRGYDADGAVVEKALANVRRAGLEGIVRISCKPLAALRRPTHRPIECGLILSNPPYGERLGAADQLKPLYREWGMGILREFPGWQAGLLTTDKELGMATGLRSHHRYTLYNGALPCTLLLFELSEANRLRPRGEPRPPREQSIGLSAGAKMFANRIRKNLKKLATWADREGISCYRIYDADMPEYAVAVDRYGEFLHVAEYRAPRKVDPEAAARRLLEVRRALPEATGIPEENIFYKVRERQRGAAQYRPTGASDTWLEVSEGGVRLLVNLSAYLDTGLFLDHRPLRLRIAREAAGRDFLNLFCYTASATLHAAAGGASSTTSIDLSKTYLDWARRNLALNGFATEDHRLLRADCREWLTGDDRLYDLILLDPPSFSNSKRMHDDFDVQRDHAALLQRCTERLRPGGILYFSNNLRSFRMDDPLVDSGRFEDITAQTIDLDFQRNTRIHRCWRYEKT